MSTLTSYLEQREQLHARLADQAPAALLDGFAAAAQRLDAVDFAARAPKVGDEAPDFALPDQHGDEVWLSALLRGGPVVLISTAVNGARTATCSFGPSRPISRSSRSIARS